MSASTQRGEVGVRLTKQDWLLAALTCTSALLFAGVSYGQAVGISQTKHNLGSTGVAGNNQTSSTEEICVFCHTPHGADNSAAAPLWNKSIPTSAVYKVYDTGFSSTIDGEVLPVGSVSVTCLSCHDGTQAMDNIINAPGSGGYNTTGGGPNGLNWSWTGSTVDVATGKLLAPTATSGVANLGADLTNDHPIGIEYCGGGLSGSTITAQPTVTTGTCKDSDFKKPMVATINAQPVWWVETGTDAVRTRTDMVLYTRDFANGKGPSVECASCHDPHVSFGQAGPNGKTAGATFLRVANTGSAVCLSCHTK